MAFRSHEIKLHMGDLVQCIHSDTDFINSVENFHLPRARRNHGKQRLLSVSRNSRMEQS